MASLTKLPIEPLKEMIAYESLWKNPKISFKKLSRIFAMNPDSRPSDFVNRAVFEETSEQIKTILFQKGGLLNTNVLINGTFDYPKKLKDAKDPIEILYYLGNINYLSTRGIAVVGSRKPSNDGIRRAEKLVRLLVKDNFTIVSGLASGIDTKAHQTAIEQNGRTIAVIATPLNKVYPKENADLQAEIAKNHLLISQVPFIRYRQQGINRNRLFFPERNKTMSALTEATIIVEASDTSGTLIQAKAALYQKRKLFILDSCFHRKDSNWPNRFLGLGAIRIKEYKDFLNNLALK